MRTLHSSVPLSVGSKARARDAKQSKNIYNASLLAFYIASSRPLILALNEDFNFALIACKDNAECCSSSDCLAFDVLETFVEEISVHSLSG